MNIVTIRQALDQAASELAGSDSGQLDAQVLLAHVLGKSRTWLMAWPDKALDPTQLSRFRELVRRRGGGEPVAYLVGMREFWSLALKVSPATLIPRPETELLVERALELGDPERELEILDLGTGSGAIALAMASEWPRSRVTAVELSAEAIAVARDNAHRLGLGNIEFHCGSWFEPLAGRRYDIILANPPYVAEGDPHLVLGDLPFEPPQALTAGSDGLRDLRHIVDQAAGHLHDGGWLLLEHGLDQGLELRELLSGRGFTQVETLRDLAGLERVSLGRLTAVAVAD